MPRRIIIGLFLTVLTFGLPAPATACADLRTGIALGPFPAPAGEVPFFWAAEGSGSFTVRFSGDDCGRRLPVTADHADLEGSATEPEDYQVANGSTGQVCGTDPDASCPTTRTIPFTSNGGDGGLAEPVTESFTVTLSNPSGGVVDEPGSAGVFLVDVHGARRVAFADLPYRQSETETEARIPVFRAGDASGSASVDYALGPGPANPATPGADFSPASGTLSFGSGQRAATIDLTIVNDTEVEAPEEITVTLADPSAGLSIEAPASITFTIDDNEELLAPLSRLHHPRHGRKYRSSSYRIREIHVFTDDHGGSEVVAADLAIRRNHRKGRCAWWNGRRFRQGPCGKKRWLSLEELQPDFFIFPLRALRASIGTGIADYTAFSRAIDGAGNVETRFRQRQNANTFEVKRRKGKRR